MPTPPQTPAGKLLAKLQRRTSQAQGRVRRSGGPPLLFSEAASEQERNDHDEAEGDWDEDSVDENAALERRIEQLISSAERSEAEGNRLVALNEELRRELEMERSKSRRAAERDDTMISPADARRIVNDAKASDMIIKALQKDNEVRVLEADAYRQRCKVMSEFLARQYGEDDWERVVGLSSSGPQTPSATRLSASAAAPPSAVAVALAGGESSSLTSEGQTLASRRSMSPLKSALLRSSSPEKAAVSALLGDQSELGDSSFVSAADVSFAPSRLAANGNLPAPSMANTPRAAGFPAEAAATSTNTTGSAGLDAAALLRALSAARLLIQGFERRDALRRSELDELLNRALEGQQDAERLAERVASSLQSQSDVGISGTGEVVRNATIALAGRPA